MVLPWLFLITATIGGTVLVCQFVLTVVGLGSEFEIADDVPDDLPDDVPTVPTAHGPDPELGEHAVGHGNFSTWLFGMLSFKTITAALAFFGLAGYAAYSGGMNWTAQLVIALLAGFGAMYGVHWLMKSLARLSQNGTIKLNRSVGKEGTVYVPIPANRGGAGKVHFKLQGRLVEYAAITSHDEPLKTGRKVRIVNIVAASTLEVEPVVEPKPVDAVA